MKRQQDHYTRKAKSAGYPARSVFKLEEINDKSRVLRPGNSVLDVGAAPGSWTQYAMKAVGPHGRVVAVDLTRFSLNPAPPNVTIHQGDITDADTRSRLAQTAPYDVVLSDAAPATTGNRTVDTARSAAIVDAVIDLALDLIKPGGKLVVKIFQGGEEKVFLERLKGVSDSARIFKPQASRSESFETFLIAIGVRPDRVRSTRSASTNVR
ncbi:MAG: RlmE family RNA methyltransferase [Spirochaetaceae bacterium]|nr:MAG: RlmE family RNA methyltransferase [Spirochaetaceae bacterium]